MQGTRTVMHPETTLLRLPTAMLVLAWLCTAPVLHAQRQASATATLHVPPVVVVHSISAPSEQNRESGYVELSSTVTASANTEYTIAVSGLPESSVPTVSGRVLVRDAHGEYRPLNPGAAIDVAAVTRPCDGCSATVRYRLPVQPGETLRAQESPPFRVFMSAR